METDDIFSSLGGSLMKELMAVNDDISSSNLASLESQLEAASMTTTTQTTTTTTSAPTSAGNPLNTTTAASLAAATTASAFPAAPSTAPPLFLSSGFGGSSLSSLPLPTPPTSGGVSASLSQATGAALILDHQQLRQKQQNVPLVPTPAPNTTITPPAAGGGGTDAWSLSLGQFDSLAAQDFLRADKESKEQKKQQQQTGQPQPPPPQLGTSSLSQAPPPPLTSVSSAGKPTAAPLYTPTSLTSPTSAGTGMSKQPPPPPHEQVLGQGVPETDGDDVLQQSAQDLVDNLLEDDEEEYDIDEEPSVMSLHHAHGHGHGLASSTCTTPVPPSLAGDEESMVGSETPVGDMKHGVEGMPPVNLGGAPAGWSIPGVPVKPLPPQSEAKSQPLQPPTAMQKDLSVPNKDAGAPQPVVRILKKPQPQKPLPTAPPAPSSGPQLSAKTTPPQPPSGGIMPPMPPNQTHPQPIPPPGAIPPMMSPPNAQPPPPQRPPHPPSLLFNDPSSPPIPAHIASSSIMPPRDLTYVIHAMLRPLQTTDDYYYHKLHEQTRLAVGPYYAYNYMRAPRVVPKEVKERAKEDELKFRSVIVSKAKDWKEEKQVLGHVVKTDVKRPRALLATPVLTTAAGSDGSSSGSEQGSVDLDDVLRRNLWKSRMQVDKGCRALIVLGEVQPQLYARSTKEDPAAAAEERMELMTRAEDSLQILHDCLGMKKKKQESKEEEGKTESPPSTSPTTQHEVDVDVLGLTLSLPKGQEMLARSMERGLLPHDSAAEIMPHVLHLIFSKARPGNVSEGVARKEDRLLGSLTQIIRLVHPSLSLETLLDCLTRVVDLAKGGGGDTSGGLKVILGVKGRAEVMHAILARGGEIMNGPPPPASQQQQQQGGNPGIVPVSEEVRRAWSGKEAEFLAMLSAS